MGITNVYAFSPDASLESSDFFDLSSIATCSDTTASSNEPLVASRPRTYEYAFTAGEVRNWMGTERGRKETQALFNGLGITDRRDQKMVSGLAFLHKFPLPLDVRGDAYGLMADFVKAQKAQRAAPAGTPEKDRCDQALNEVRTRAWAFLDTFILPKDQDGKAQLLRPALTPYPRQPETF